MRGVVSSFLPFFLSNLRFLVDLSEDSLGETMFVKCFDNGAARVLIEFWLCQGFYLDSFAFVRLNVCQFRL